MTVATGLRRPLTASGRRLSRSLSTMFPPTARPVRGTTWRRTSRGSADPPATRSRLRRRERARRATGRTRSPGRGRRRADRRRRRRHARAGRRRHRTGATEMTAAGVDGTTPRVTRGDTLNGRGGDLSRRRRDRRSPARSRGRAQRQRRGLDGGDGDADEGAVRGPTRSSAGRATSGSTVAGTGPDQRGGWTRDAELRGANKPSVRHAERTT